MADDGVIPIGDVERAVGAELHVDGAEAGVRASDERRKIVHAEARTVVLDLERPDGVVDVAAEDERALPFGGPVRVRDDVRPAGLTTARVDPDIVASADGVTANHLRHGIGDAAVVAGVDERLTPVGEDDAPGILWIGGSAVEGVEPKLARAQSPEAGFIQAHNAERRFDAGTRVESLAEVKFAAGRPAEGVDILMIVTGAEAAEHDGLLIRHVVAVGVAQVKQLRAFAEVTAARVAIQLDAGGNHQPAREDGGLVRRAIVVGVFEDDDFVIGHFAGLELRIDGAADDPEPAARVPAALDGLHDAVGLGGEKIDLEAGRDGERGEFRGRQIGVGTESESEMTNDQ